MSIADITINGHTYKDEMWRADWEGTISAIADDIAAIVAAKDLVGVLHKVISGDVTLDGTESSNLGFIFTGALSGATKITFAAGFEGPAVIVNATTGGIAPTCGLAAGAAVTIPISGSAIVFCDGTDFTLPAGIVRTATGVYAFGDFGVESDLAVGGDAVITGDLSAANIASAGTLNAAGPATIGGAATVTGAITGGSTLNIAGAATVGGAASITGAIAGGSTLNLADAATIGGAASVTGAISGGSTLAIADAVSVGGAAFYDPAGSVLYVGTDGVFYFNKQTFDGVDYSYINLGPSSYFQFNRSTKVLALVLDGVAAQTWPA